MLIFMMN